MVLVRRMRGRRAIGFEMGRQLTHERTRVHNFLDCKSLETQVHGEFVCLQETPYIIQNIYCSLK